MLRPSLLALAAAFVAAACASSSSNTPPPADAGSLPDASDEAALDAAGDTAVDAAVDTALDGGITVEVYGHTDLPRTSSTEGLSATAFDPASRTLYALQDTVPSVVPLVASEDYSLFVPGAAIALTGRPSSEWDGEGLALLGGGFVAVTVETNPTVERFSIGGAYQSPVNIPAIYAEQRPGNKGNESLSVAPSGKYLFTSSEQALTVDGDGPTKTAGTVVRIARLSSDTFQGTQHAYRTEPLGPGTGGDMGVSDLAALDDDTLLVLERGYQSDYGNTVRLYRVSLSGAADVSSQAALGADAPVVQKQLLVDFAMLASQGFTHPSKQPNPILDNYEALSIGPVLGDGRRLLFVTSDDNAQATQVARVLVLALRGI